MIFCYAWECINNQNGYCTRNEVTLNDDRECTDYEDYAKSPEYKTEFWKAIEDNGKPYKQKDYGKRAEKNGVVFFYLDKELNENTRITEEKTGRLMAYRHLERDDILSKIEKTLAEQGNVADLPEWDGGEEND